MNAVVWRPIWVTSTCDAPKEERRPLLEIGRSSGVSVASTATVSLIEEDFGFPETLIRDPDLSRSEHPGTGMGSRICDSKTSEYDCFIPFEESFIAQDLVRGITRRETSS